MNSDRARSRGAPLASARAASPRRRIRRGCRRRSTELHQLDLRYEGLRKRSPRRERQLLASLSEIGQYGMMHERDASREFARRLWRSLLGRLAPSLIVCLGAEPEVAVRETLGAALFGERFPVGWGNQLATVSRYPDRIVLRLPHLSRFKAFGRLQSQAPLESTRESRLKEVASRIPDLRNSAGSHCNGVADGFAGRAAA